MEINKDFVPHEEALALKELGFDEPCFGLWNLNNGKHEVDVIGVCKYSKEFKYREVLAPLYQQAFRWFREQHKLSGVPTHQSYDIYNIETGECITEVYPLESYEEAQLACLRKLIEIVKQ